MLIERDDELRQVDALLEQVADGAGGVLLVEGEPGIGKTALLTVLRRRAESRGFASMTARGGEIEADLAFGIARQLVEPRRRAADDDVGNPHAFYWACSNLADQAPLLVTVDDAHWSDLPSLRMLSHVARRLDDLAVLLVLTARPPTAHTLDVAERALGGVPYRRLRLGPLSEDGVGRIVRHDLSADADRAFCRACAQASGGNPFLLHEALAALQADGVEPRADEAERVATIRPDTIARALLSRLARLGPDAALLARAVAVLGPDAELRLASRLAGLDGERAAAACDALVEDGVLMPSRPLEFVHPLVRTAVYGDTAPARRALDHKRAARLLHDEGADASRVAPHLVATEPDDDPWVVEVLHEAARTDLAQGAPEPAATFLERARREPAAPGVLGDLLFLLGTALARANRHAEAAAVLGEALTHADGEQLVDVAVELAQLLTLAGMGAQALALLAELRARLAADAADAGADHAGPDATGVTTLMLRVEASTGFAALGAIQPTREWIDRAVAIAGALPGDDEHERSLLGVLAFAGAAVGDPDADEVARLAGRARPPDPDDVARSIDVNLSSSALAIADRLPEAMEILDHGIDAVRRRGDLFELTWLSVIRSHTAYYAGRLLDAEADGRTALSLVGDQPALTLLAVGVLVDALVERGMVDEAAAILPQYADDAGQELSLLPVHFFLLGRAHLRLHQGAPQAALDDLLACGAQLAGAGYVNPGFALWRSDAVRAHLALGQHDEARRLADDDLRLARRFGAPHAVGSALRARAVVEGGPAGIVLLEEAVAVLDRSTSLLERARAVVDHGAALRRDGRRQHAQEVLRRGLDAADRIGAVTLAARARDELVAAGARPRRAAITGPASLTASELRVARLAAQGRSNREIAQTLFVSRRTVEVHLTSSYRKLAITSRSALAGALADHLSPDPNAVL